MLPEVVIESTDAGCARTLFSLTSDAAGSAKQLASILDTLPAGEIFVQDHAALRGLIQAAGVAREIRWSSQGGPREVSQATISLAEALVAQTGSIFVTAACGGRGVSVVAPCHIVYGKTNQLVPDLKTALGSASSNGVIISRVIVWTARTQKNVRS